ncbi:MAG: hypothetical protein LC620_00630 [Halobacteriales archaeon]|nr:hypothetical protein [Halobacteriales archaeon]
MPDATPAWSQQSAPAPVNPMETHVKVIAIIDVVFGALAALGALVILAVFGAGAAATGATTHSGWAGFIAAFGVLIALFIGLFAALGLTAGILLLRRRRAGKGFGIAAAILQLFSFPIGTALGVYALVILTKRETEQVLVG